MVDMELHQVLRQRRMTRDFTDEALEEAVVDRLARCALRGPSAGFAQGLDVVVLSTRADTDRYWRAALPVDERGDFPWPGLLRAPLILVLVCHEEAYRSRYRKADKVRRRGRAGEEWSVPWWYFDAGAAAAMVLLAATAEGLGALLFAVARSETVASVVGVPVDHQLVAAVAIGHPGPGDRPSSSLAAGRRPATETIHRGSW